MIKNKILSVIIISFVLLINSIILQYVYTSGKVDPKFKNGLFSVSNAYADNAYMEDITYYYNEDGYTMMQFTAVQDFSISYRTWSAGGCTANLDADYGTSNYGSNSNIMVSFIDESFIDESYMMTCPSTNNTPVAFNFDEGVTYTTYVMHYYNLCSLSSAGGCLLNEINYLGNFLKVPTSMSDSTEYLIEEEPVQGPTGTNITINDPLCDGEEESIFTLDVSVFSDDVENMLDYDLIDFYFVEPRYFDEDLAKNTKSYVFTKNFNWGVSNGDFTFEVPYLSPDRTYKMYAVFRNSANGYIVLPDNMKDESGHIKSCLIDIVKSVDDIDFEDFISGGTISGGIDKPIQEDNGTYKLRAILDSNGDPFDPALHNSLTFKTNVGGNFDLELGDLTNDEEIVKDDIKTLCSADDFGYKCVFSDIGIKDLQSFDLSIRIYDDTLKIYTLNFTIVGDDEIIERVDTQFSGFGNFFRGLFVPSAGHMSRLRSMYASYRYVFPWGIYFKFTDMISGSYADKYEEVGDILGDAEVSFEIDGNKLVIGSLTPNQEIVTSGMGDNVRIIADGILGIALAMGIFNWVLDYRDRTMD